LRKDTSSWARLASRRFRMGENGGSWDKLRNARSRKLCAGTVAITMSLSDLKPGIFRTRAAHTLG
jgi:hypothetical protein